MAENKNEIPYSSPMSIKMDLARFKDEILKDIRSVQLSLDDKYLKADDILKQRIIEFEIKINIFNQKISELSNLIFKDNSIVEKVESLEQFKEEIKDIIFKRRAKFNDFETKVNNDIDRINNVLTTSVLYPSIIGNSAKFKNFHDFIDYVVKELGDLVKIKEKSGFDLTPYKKRIDQTIIGFKILMNKFVTKEYIDNLLKGNEEKITNLLKIYDERLEEARIANSKLFYSLQKKFEENSKYINKILENFDNYNDDMNYVKNRLNKINEVIKELLSYHPTTKNNYIHEFEKKTSKVYSGVKQYIKGNLNANELSSMKKFTYEKSKTTKIYDKSFPSPITSPFPTPDTNKTYNGIKKRNSYAINNSEHFLKNYQSSSSKDSNLIIDKSKLFLRQKSLNPKNNSNSLNKKLNQQDSNKKVNFFDKNEKTIFRKNMLIKKNTFNADLNSFESSKKIIEGLRIKYKSNQNLNNGSDLNDIVNEDSSFSNKKDEIFHENSDIDEKSLRSNYSRKESNKNNQFIIKEEDENISDNSCKNLGSTSRRKNQKKKTINSRKSSNEEKDKKIISKEEDNKTNLNN